jgi:hypothetical protein
MFAYLNRPYPYKFTTIQDVGFYLFIGVFVSVFLAFFQPFDINLWETDRKPLKLVGYGVVAFIVPLSLTIVRKFIVNERKLEYTYKIKHEILWLFIIIACIAAANLFYSNWIGILHINFSSFLLFLGVVITVGIFPVLGSIWLKHKQYLALNYKEAAAIEANINTNPKEIRDEGQEILFIAENEKESLSIVSSGLLYIESMDNYCQFVFMKDGQVKKQILRGPLKRFESQISLFHLRKCHRSFIVNLENVIHIDGNAQGYTLYLNQEGVTVPVSRNFGPEIKKFFSKSA